MSEFSDRLVEKGRQITSQARQDRRCDCPECYCVQTAESRRTTCAMCRRGWHRPGARKPL